MGGKGDCMAPHRNPERADVSDPDRVVARLIDDLGSEADAVAWQQFLVEAHERTLLQMKGQSGG